MTFHSKPLGKELPCMFPKTPHPMGTVSVTEESGCFCGTRSSNGATSATWLWELQISQH